MFNSILYFITKIIFLKAICLFLFIDQTSFDLALADDVKSLLLDTMLHSTACVTTLSKSNLGNLWNPIDCSSNNLENFIPVISSNDQASNFSERRVQCQGRESTVSTTGLLSTVTQMNNANNNSDGHVVTTIAKPNSFDIVKMDKTSVVDFLFSCGLEQFIGLFEREQVIN